MDIDLRLKNLSLFLFQWMGLYGSTNLIALLTNLLIAYYAINNTVMTDITPQALANKKKMDEEVFLKTKFYGVMFDMDIMKMYRTQRLLNVLNKIVANVGIAFHHDACLATFSALIFFAILHNNVLNNGGFLGYFTVGTCLITPLTIIACENAMLGMLADFTNEFQQNIY